MKSVIDVPVSEVHRRGGVGQASYMLTVDNETKHDTQSLLPLTHGNAAH